MFGLQNFNEANKFDTKHADKLLAHYQSELNKHKDADLQEMLSEEKTAVTTEEADAALEQMINESIKDDKICKTYKLFNYVCQQYPE